MQVGDKAESETWTLRKGILKEGSQPLTKCDARQMSMLKGSRELLVAAQKVVDDDSKVRG